MYRGKVTAVDASGVYVQTAEYGTLGPCQAVVANYAVGDMVLCVNVGDEASPELVVVGKLTIDNATITTPGAFVAGNGATTSQHITINAPKDTANADIGFRANGSNRWTIRRTANTESGSSAGSNLAIIRRDDSGTAVQSALQINRATGKVTIGAVGSTAGIELGSGGPTITVGTGAPSHAPPDGSVYLRTDGTASTTLYVRAVGAWTALS